MKEPIYKQIEKYLKDLIESDTIKPGEFLPSEMQLSEEFNVTRMTVRSAFNNLVKEGYIKRQRGVGTIVLANKMYDNINTIRSFSKEIESKGYDASTILIDLKVIKADEKLAKNLQIEKGDNLWEIKRVRLANGLRISYLVTYMPLKLFPNLNESHCKHSIYKYIEEECHLKIAVADRKVEAMISTDELIEILELEEEAPILYIEQMTRLETGECFEYSHTYHYGYTLTLQVKSE